MVVASAAQGTASAQIDSANFVMKLPMIFFQVCGIALQLESAGALAWHDKSKSLNSLNSESSTNSYPEAAGLFASKTGFEPVGGVMSPPTES